jgi:hypothetical protein
MQVIGKVSCFYASHATAFQPQNSTVMKTGSYPENKSKRTRRSKAKPRVQDWPAPAKRTRSLRDFSDGISSHYYPVSLPTQLFLLNVDPHCLHATWNIRAKEVPDTGSSTTEDQPEQSLLLKLYLHRPSIKTGKDNAILIRSVPVQGFENAHYIHSLKGPGIYQAEIGMLHENRFTPLLRSNTIHVPPPRIRKERQPPMNWMPNANVPPPRQLSLEQAKHDEAVSATIADRQEHVPVTPTAVFPRPPYVFRTPQLTGRIKIIGLLTLPHIFEQTRPPSDAKSWSSHSMPQRTI